MIVAGMLLGIVLSLGLTRLISSLLFGVTPHDPMTFAIVGLLLVAVSLLACAVPALRAARLDPMAALRYE
jgi:putative ABC transport system permease protein